MRYFTLLLAIMLPWVAFSQKNIKKSIFFDVDKAELRADALPVLDDLIGQAQKMPDFDLALEAFTDDQGTAEYNQALAQRRADAVYNYLSAQHCPAKTVAIKAIGKVAVAMKGKATIDQARQQNRRVDVILKPNKIESFRELDDLLSQKGAQQFNIVAGEAQTIVAQGGTTIYVPAGSLVFPDGTPPNGKITVVVKEALTPMDWISNNLSTVDVNGELLQTGGMFFLDAQAGGKALRIKKGASISISMPAVNGQVDPEMQLFSGKTTASGQPIVWVPMGDDMPLPMNAPKTFGQKKEWESRRQIDSTVRAHLNSLIWPEDEPPLPQIDRRRLNLARKNIPTPPKDKSPTPPAMPNAWGKEQDLLTAKEQKANQKYRLLSSRYQYAQQSFDKKWAAYRKDSADIVNAKAYREACQKEWIAYEDALFAYFVIRRWNAAIQPNRAMLTGLPWIKYVASGNCCDIQHIYHGFMEGKKNVSGRRNYYRRLLGLELVPKRYVLKKIKPNKRRLFERLRGERAFYVSIANPIYQKQFSERFDQIGQRQKEIIMSRNNLGDITATLEQWIVTQDPRSLMEYSFTITNLGWANCDRFYDMSRENRAPVIAQGDGNTRMFLICSSRQIALPMHYKGGKFASDNIPEGLVVKLVAVKLEKGIPSLSIQELTTDGKNIASAPIFEEVSLVKMREILSKV